MIALAERLGSKIRKTKAGCWIWLGARSQRYGVLKVNGRLRGAHRVQWEITRGPIPPGMFVLHRCDVPRCVNPGHLFLGTHADNMHDMVRKGRRKGSKQSGALLTEKQARRVKYGSERICDLARLFGVPYTAVSNIRNGYSWKHI